MKTHRTPRSIAVLALSLTLSSGALGALNTLAEWGDAAGTTPPAAFTVNGGTIAITGGGADFWGTSDQGVFLWDNTGANTTTGDFTATVRHVSTTTPAPEWGRDGIIVRATQTLNTPAANDAHWLAHRKSNGQYVTGRRPTTGADTYRATDIGNAGVDYNSDANAREVPTGNVTNSPVFISAGREGNRLHSGLALDLGGVAGRWVEHWSTDVPAAISGLQGNAQVIVGLAHQSHPQTISPDSNDINTATFDNWTYTGSYVASKFGAPAGPTTWQLGGNVAIPATGAVTGAAYVQEGGVATGENVKWTISAYENSTFVGRFDLAGSIKNPKGMEVADLVPPANLRHAVGATFEAGLKADIFFHANDGNFAALNTYMAGNPPDGTTVLPRIHWSHPDAGIGYPPNGMGGDLFSDAVAAFDTAGDGQEDYGVNLTGQIFIPADADRVSLALPGPEMLLFQDGVDDFCYLQIDGRVLINDNDWTGNSSTENGGGNTAMLNVSNAKYDDGEWVSFRMITWEGGGGDTASLYWNAFDTNGSFGIGEVPKTAGSIGDIIPIIGLPGSKKNPTAMAVADLVPPANFRYDNGGTFEAGLKADIYMQNNAGNLGAFDTIVAGGPPDGTAILPRIHWSETANPPYPPNIPPDASNKFADAVPGSFAPGSNQESYGVNMTGQIFIPGDAARHALNAPGGDTLIAFKDGVDDFCYLEIDGVPLINDNDWTGNTTVDNGGGNISLFDASAAKFDDGEWVPFRMVMWEGGGGDKASLYWSALDANNTITQVQIPSLFTADKTFGGLTQVGSQTATAPFPGVSLPAGSWTVQLTVENTGTRFAKFASAMVTAVPAAAPQITTVNYNPATTTLNLTFTSEAGANYALDYTIGFLPAGAPTSASKWNTVSSHASIPGVAGTTSIAPLNTTTLVTPGGQLPNNSQVYVRVRRL